MPTQRMHISLVTAGVLFSVSAGQAQVAPLLPGVTQQIATASLPDSPGAVVASSSAVDAGSSSTLSDSLSQMGGGASQQAPAALPTDVAPKYSITIKAGQAAQPLSAADKLVMGFRKQVALGALASWTASAGFSHLLDNRPHYGTDSAGYGERLGAAALRDTSQSVFYYGVYSNLFRQDPRYYVLGPQHHFQHRAVYAASRVVITRKDKGGTAVNWSLLSGIASSAALANAYYPSRDQSVRRTATGILTSLALRAGTQELREFSGEIRHALHLKSK